MIGMQTPSVRRVEHRSASLARAERGHPLVDPPVDLLLDPVEEPRHELLVVAGPSSCAGGEGRLELLLGLGLHAGTMAQSRIRI